jgi:phosphoribosylformylglycinamidine synthase
MEAPLLLLPKWLLQGGSAHGDRSGTGALAPVLFGEDQGRYLVTTTSPDAVMDEARARHVFAADIGITGGEAIVVQHQERISVALSDLRRAHEDFFPRLMGPDAALA